MGSSNLTTTCRTCVTLPCGETLTVRAASARCVALKKPIASNETAAADASVQVRFFMTLIIECAPGCPKPLAILPERYVNLTIVSIARHDLMIVCIGCALPRVDAMP